jgi:hypothetical protein
MLTARVGKTDGQSLTAGSAGESDINPCLKLATEQRFGRVEGCHGFLISIALSVKDFIITGNDIDLHIRFAIDDAPKRAFLWLWGQHPPQLQE